MNDSMTAKKRQIPEALREQMSKAGKKGWAARVAKAAAQDAQQQPQPEPAQQTQKP